jgi:carbonic anhydrase
MISAQEALQKLREGNARFASTGQGQGSPEAGGHHFKSIDRQEPFAIILGCSDSRVPPEVVFDRGVGELFVVRVAGNIVTPAQTGSIEFAAEKFGSRLVVVLGHTMCGAIRATMDELANPAPARQENLHSIVDSISPCLEPLIKATPQVSEDDLLREAMRENIRHSVQQLQQQSPILRKQINEQGLEIIGAEYCVSSGVVDFLTPEAN